MAPDGSTRWNHNIHYHRLIETAVPPGARTALDVGTGNGLLAADLSRTIPQVTAIDIDTAVLRSARLESDAVEWIRGDVLTHPLASRSFDVVASVATLHHLPDLTGALHRCADLVAPGGVLAIVGIARTSRPRDVLLHLGGQVQHRYLSWRHGFWEHTAPMVWPPPHTYAEVEQAVHAELPSARWRQLPMWRYLIVWRRPDRLSR
ncbi:class I SAM-dependent methyltransferase [Williamsia sterculiae]|uniref:Methyltransferase domain-containing protein n=1 Tax=Williamsia sterculiae TaxID=1344003 RepID=A0A1N7DSZ0_9NOCA|nr:class I SAM-dependent methyltransferase [Williamsia sterculiae]SIR79013.1 Methyltransferase domain-containing protein [Williamsia sterculiae]